MIKLRVCFIQQNINQIKNIPNITQLRELFTIIICCSYS
uniref:Uncharacterized protein n=1 Tax=Arundo donax TaxID=35708 RepID=A0A0A9FK80_ARUDO